MADRIEDLFKDWEPKIKAAFLEAVKAIRDSVVLGDLVKMLKARDIEGALKAVGIDPARFRPLSLALEQGYEAGGIDATLQIKPQVGPLGIKVGAVFDIRAPSADGWLRNYTASLITQITEEQRAAVRQILAPLQSGQDAMLTGDTPQKLALDLVGRINRATGHREGGYIGLTSQSADWAANYERELRTMHPGALTRKLRDRRFDKMVQRAISEGKPLPPEKIEVLVSTYKNKALLLRANTIALNEASTVMHASQMEAWEQAVRRGVVAEAAIRRRWVTAQDDRVRPTHRVVPGMNPKGVGLHQPFQTPKGPTMQPGWAFDPGCRCRVRITVVEDDSPVIAPAAPERVLLNA